MVCDGDKVVVIDRKKPNWPGVTFPGGHVEKDESLTDSVIREVKEETGLTIKKPLLCGMEEFKTDKEDRYFMFFYKTDKYSGKIKSSKEGEVFWVDIRDLHKYKLSHDLKRILRVINDNNLSEIIYYKKQNKWLSKIV